MALLRHCLAQVRRKHLQSELADEGLLHLVSPPESLVFAWLQEGPSASAMRRHASSRRHQTDGIAPPSTRMTEPVM